jgi:hypothetical protein
LAANEQCGFEQRDMIATELVECALGVVGNTPAVLELHAIGVFRLGEGFDHVTALSQQSEVWVEISVVGVAVLAKEKLGVAGASELEIGLG